MKTFGIMLSVKEVQKIHRLLHCTKPVVAIKQNSAKMWLTAAYVFEKNNFMCFFKKVLTAEAL